MKTKHFIALTIACLIPLTSFAQQKEEVEQEIERASHEVEVISADEIEDPLAKLEAEKCDENDPDKKYKPNTNLWNTIKHLAADTGGILIAPAGWKKDDWLKAAAVVAGVMLISTQDKQIKEFAQSIRTPVGDNISAGFEKFGNGGMVLPALGLGYAASVMIKNDKLKNTTLTALESATVAAVLTTLGKHIFHRTRPYKTDNPYEFDPGNFKSSNVSFPSGHTGTAFAIATVFAEAYKDNSIIPYLAYSAATLVGLSRIYDNKHWASDVALGAALGYAAGKFVSNRRLGNSGITIVPSFSFSDRGSVNVSVTIPIGGKKKKK